MTVHEKLTGYPWSWGYQSRSGDLSGRWG